jgi:hypothetical protein
MFLQGSHCYLRRYFSDGPRFLVELEFGHVDFSLEGGKPESPVKKLSKQGREPTNNYSHITQSGNQTRAIVVRAVHYCHYSTYASHVILHYFLSFPIYIAACRLHVLS